MPTCENRGNLLRGIANAEIYDGIADGMITVAIRKIIIAERRLPEYDLRAVLGECKMLHDQGEPELKSPEC